MVLFWDIVGLTLFCVRVGAGDGRETEGSTPRSGAVALDSAFATAGRFGEVFSKLRAGTVVLGGGPLSAPRLAPVEGAG